MEVGRKHTHPNTHTHTHTKIKKKIISRLRRKSRKPAPVNIIEKDA